MTAAVTLCKKRWLVAALVAFLGASYGYSVVFLGVINTTLSSYFNLTPSMVDWLALSTSVGVAVGCVPFGLYASLKPMKMRVFAVSALIIEGTAFVIIAVVLIYRKLPTLIAPAQFMTGITTAMFMALIGLANTVWFSESEQGTIYGLAWAAVGVGNVISALLPAVVLKSMKTTSIRQKAEALAYIYLGFSAVGACFLMLTMIFIPDLPPNPPSRVEAERRERFTTKDTTNWRKVVKRSCNEIKVLLSDRISASLFFSFGLVFGILNMFFLVQPSIAKGSGNSGLTNDTSPRMDDGARKAFTLVWFSVGTVAGSFVIGVLMDRMKSYYPLAAFVAPSSLITSLGTLVCFVFSSVIGMDICQFFLGVALSCTYTFAGEILKQYAYPKVSDVIQGIALAVVSNGFPLISSSIARRIRDTFGDLYFFVFASVCCVFVCVLLLSVKPTLKRFQAEVSEKTEHSHLLHK